MPRALLFFAISLVISGLTACTGSNATTPALTGPFVEQHRAIASCFDTSFVGIIETEAAWESWWAMAYSCDMGLARPIPPVPTIDFGTTHIFTLGLVNDSFTDGGLGGFGITRIQPSAEGTTITYEIGRPGNGCPIPGLIAPLAPTLAVEIPADLPRPVRFIRVDITKDCTEG